MFPETRKCAVSPRQYDTNTISVLMFFAKKCIQHPILTPGAVNQLDTQYIQTREKRQLVTSILLLFFSNFNSRNTLETCVSIIWPLIYWCLGWWALYVVSRKCRSLSDVAVQSKTFLSHRENAQPNTSQWGFKVFLKSHLNSYTITISKIFHVSTSTK